MPLIINELVTVVEKPAGDTPRTPQATGAGESDTDAREWLEISREREERLRCD